MTLFSCRIGRHNLHQNIEVSIGGNICTKNATVFYADDLCYRFSKIDQNISCDYEITEGCIVKYSLLAKKKKINLNDELLELVQSDILSIGKLITRSSSNKESLINVLNSEKNLFYIDHSKKTSSYITANYKKSNLNLQWFSKFRNDLIKNQSIDVFPYRDSRTDRISFLFTESIELTLQNVTEVNIDNTNKEFWVSLDVSGAKQLVMLSKRKCPLLISIDNFAFSIAEFSEVINTCLMKSKMLNIYDDADKLEERIDVYSKSLIGTIIN